MKKLMLLVFLIPAIYAGFKWGLPPINRFLDLNPCEGCAEDGQPSVFLSDLTMDRFERLRWGESDDKLVLASVEVSSVVRYAVPGIIPLGLLEPRVEFEEEQIRLSALVIAEKFPGLPKLDEIIGLLPDTIAVEMEGMIAPLDQGHFALIINGLWMAKIPIPSSLIPAILTAFGREGRRALPRNALLIPKPDGIESAFVRADSLFLLANPEREEHARDEDD